MGGKTKIRLITESPEILFLNNARWVSQVVLVKNLPANAGALRDEGFDPWAREMPWRTAWQPTPVFLPGESQGQRSLAGYSPWGGRVRYDQSELAHTHT